MKRLSLSLLLSIFCFGLFGQTDILDARTNYSVGQVVTVTGIVTSGPEFGPVRYIQDESAGIAVYPGGSWAGWDEPVPGDEVTVTASLTEFNGLLEVGPPLNSFSINGSGFALPEATVITPSQIGEPLEGSLVMLFSCVFDNGGATITGGSTYSFISSGEQGVIFIRNGHPLIGSVLPISPVTLVGILSQFSFDGVGGYQVLPRSAADFILDSSINLTSAVDQTNLSTSGFTLSWNTDVAGSSTVEYGPTPALGLTASSPGNVTSHSVNLSGLEPGTIYFARALSSDGNDIAESGISAYTTVSESSGDIVVYFNGSVDVSVATLENAISLGNDLNDTVAAYIDRVQHTLDVAVYNINDQTVVNAINDAYDRGVQIRYIAQGTNANLGIGQFNPGIPVLFREDDMGSGMHNKFMIGDADFADLAFVMGGSCNWTTENFIDDYNNVVFLHDQSLARGYRLEFEEMWGGTGDEPDLMNASFSSSKGVNTPKKYIVGGSPVEVYFSPTDNVTQAIIQTILSANSDLAFATLAFTRDDIAQAVIDRHNDFFTYVQGIIEQTSGQGNEFEILESAGVEVYSHEGISGQVHHKYAIVDATNPDSDPMVLTGSHNWSSSAETVNDENTLVIHDARVANLFYQEFMARIGGFLSVGETPENLFNVFPNPCEDKAIVDLGTAENQAVILRLYTLSGSEVVTMRAGGSRFTEIPVQGLPVGIYLLSVHSADGQRIGYSQLMVR